MCIRDSLQPIHVRDECATSDPERRWATPNAKGTASFVRSGLAANLVHHALEVVHVLEAAVDACKAHVRNLVEFLELAHDEFTDPGAGNFPHSKVQQLF